MIKLCRIISAIFSPLLVPTYGIMIALNTTVLSSVDPKIRWVLTLVVALITCVLPMVAIAALWKLGRVADTGLNRRTDRTLPYVIITLCYLGCAFYMYRIHAPLWLVMFMGGAAAAAIVSLVVNHWWKISAHGAAMGGLVAMIMRVVVDHVNIYPMVWIFSAAVIATGMVATSRLILQRHTLWQVIAGVANGFVWVYFLSAL